MSSAVAGPDGRLYVADLMNSEIRVFDEDGTFRFRRGGPGQGPHEFGQLYSLAWAADTLFALDFGNGRISLWDTTGTWLGQRRHQAGISGPRSLLRLYQVGPDEVYAWGYVAEAGGLQRVYIGHTSAAVTDTIPQPRPEWPSGSVIECEDRRTGALYFFDVPFMPRFLQHPTPGGHVATAWTSQYRLAVTDAIGDTIRLIERARDPVPTSRLEWEERLKPYEERRSDASVRCDPSLPALPAYQPPITNLLIDTTGKFWVEATVEGGKVWDVFDAEGRLVAEVPWRPYKEGSAPYLAGSEMILVQRDSLGVETVQRYRILERSSGEEDLHGDG